MGTIDVSKAVLNKWVSRFRLNLFKHLEAVVVLKGKEFLKD